MKRKSPFRHLTGKMPALLSLLLMLVMWMNVSAQNTANITMAPVTPSVIVGNTFSVMVKLDFTSPPGTSATNALEIHLTFDNTKLQVSSIVEQPTAAGFTFKIIPIEASPYTTTNTNGQINYSIATIGTIPNADFDIMQITFTAIGGGGTTTPLNFRRDPPSNNTDAKNGASILTSPFVTNGTVSITPAGCTLSAAQISNAPTCNGQPFNLLLQSVTGGQAPFDVVVNGVTYNDIPAGGVITTYTAPTQSLFTTPVSNTDDENDAAVTLGMRFRSTVAGYIKGVRFFSGASPQGTYTGQLWSNSGSLLASATFSSVTGTAWNQVLFSTPVLIAANTNYVVSYHTTDGYYTSTQVVAAPVGNLTNGYTNGSLTAVPGNANPPGNGLYTYDADPSFPLLSFGDSNYWVDVLFSPNATSFNLTSVTDDLGCNISAAPIQTLNVTSGTCAPLPVTLINLSATPQGKDVLISWATAAEFDNKGFEVQRSIDNSLWEALTFVPGAGNSGSILNYSYTDRDLVPRTYYYRLKQVDIDGKFKYSNVVAATLAGKIQYELGQNYPNPFNGETSIRYTLPASSNVTLTVFDLNGRAIKVLVNGTKGAGMHVQKFYPTSLPSGVYYYKLQAGDFTAVKKLVIQ